MRASKLRSSAAFSMVPVGLLGLHRMTAAVAAVMARAMAGRSRVLVAVSGT